MHSFRVVSASCGEPSESPQGFESGSFMNCHAIPEDHLWTVEPQHVKLETQLDMLHLHKNQSHVN